MLRFFMTISLIFSWQILLFIAPISLIACLLLLSISSSIVVGIIISTWYGIVLFIVYVGGLLVLFIYSAIISSNVKNLLKHNLIIVLIGVLSLTVFLNLIRSKTFFYVKITSLLVKNLLRLSLVVRGLDFSSFLIPLIGVFLFFVIISVTYILLRLGKIKKF